MSTTPASTAAMLSRLKSSMTTKVRTRPASKVKSGINRIIQIRLTSAASPPRPKVVNRHRLRACRSWSAVCSVSTLATIATATAGPGDRSPRNAWTSAITAMTSSGASNAPLIASMTGELSRRCSTWGSTCPTPQATRANTVNSTAGMLCSR